MTGQEAQFELALGGTLMTTPIWAAVLHDVSLIASGIAAVCGAIIGVHAVWRLCRRD